MKRDTPLPEVARALPTGVAKQLMEEDIEIQRTVCELVREAICHWEESGVILEPVAYEVVVVSVASQAIIAARLCLKLEIENQLLRSVLDGSS